MADSRTHNRWNELLSNRRLRSAGSIDLLKRELWKSIRVCAIARDESLREGDVVNAQRWTNHIAQCGHAYLKACDAGDVTKRLDELEARLEEPTYEP